MARVQQVRPGKTKSEFKNSICDGTFSFKTQKHAIFQMHGDINFGWKSICDFKEMVVEAKFDWPHKYRTHPLQYGGLCKHHHHHCCCPNSTRHPPAGSKSFEWREMSYRHFNTTAACEQAD